VSHLGAIAEVCHARGCPLITDEAWVLDYLRSGVQAGMVVPNAADTSLGSVRVMTE
jgi:hypothetical protein